MPNDKLDRSDVRIIREGYYRCDYEVPWNGKRYFVWAREDKSDQSVHVHYMNDRVTEPPMSEQLPMLQALRGVMSGNHNFDHCFNPE